MATVLLIPRSVIADEFAERQLYVGQVVEVTPANDHERVIWECGLQVWTPDQALQHAREAVDFFSYQRRHQLPLEL